MFARDKCPICLIGKLEKSITQGKLSCNTCHNYFDDDEKGVERSIARVTDPDGYEHKIDFIKVGEYWEID